MQEVLQKISPIKQRILQFIDTLNISKRDFYTKTGISRGTLESNTGITEDIMAKFIATYPEVSIEWLVLGIGQPDQPIIINQKSPTDMSNDSIASIFLKLITEKDRENQRLAEEIGTLKEQIRALKKSGGYSQNNLAAES